MTNGKRLGRGLETLLGRIGNNALAGPIPESAFEERTAAESNKIDIMRIVPNPFQPRKMFDEAELEQLAQSLYAHGLLQPITVRQVGSQYQIIAGERRFRAALRLGWSDIPAEIRNDVDDQQMAELALTENIQRKDLNAIEKATSFAKYLELYPDTTQEVLANRLQMNRSTVTNLLRLLELPKQLQDAVCQEKLTAGHARALLSLKDEHVQIEVATKVQAEGWSVRETERFVQELLQTVETAFSDSEWPWRVVGSNGETRQVPKTRKSEQIQQLEKMFRQALGGMKVKLIQTNEKGKGKLIISFANHEEFDDMYTMICRSNRAAG